MKLLHLCFCFRSWECDQFWFPNNRWRIYSQSRKVGQRTKHHIKVNFMRTEICRLCVTSWQYQTKTEVFQKSDGATRSSADRNVMPFLRHWCVFNRLRVHGRSDYFLWCQDWRIVHHQWGLCSNPGLVITCELSLLLVLLFLRVHRCQGSK